MDNAVKLGLGAALIGLLFLGNRAINLATLARSLNFKITGFGIPSINGANISIPLQAQINNASQHSVLFDQVKINLAYLNANNQYVPAAQTIINGFSITPGTTSKTFIATLNLQAITANLFNNVLTVLVNRQIPIRADVTPRLSGIDLPTQTIFETINV